jgi:N,N'-diacetyllegionaminate synthase
MAELRIGPISVAQHGVPHVIAEAGVNHNGSVDTAHRLVDAAADAGCTLVKFQVFDPARLVTDSAATADYQRSATGATRQSDMLAELVLPLSAWRELQDHATERGLVFFATAFDPASADLLGEMSVPVFKVPSGELTNLAFIRDLASRQRPLLLSTGLATMAEVERALHEARQAAQLALLHCVTAYPTPPAVSNLRAIGTMAETFDVPVGWSDHTQGSTTAIAATALGSPLFEKHLTLDRSLPGPDHAASADPDEMHAYVAAVRDAHAALGSGVKAPVDVELANLTAARRSPYAVRDLAEGQPVLESDIVMLRPAVGLGADTSFAHATLRRAVPAGAVLTDQDVTWPTDPA